MQRRTFSANASLGDFIPAFGMNRHFQGNVVLTKGLSKLCHTVVAKMLHSLPSVIVLRFFLNTSHICAILERYLERRPSNDGIASGC